MAAAGWRQADGRPVVVPNLHAAHPTLLSSRSAFSYCSNSAPVTHKKALASLSTVLTGAAPGALRISSCRRGWHWGRGGGACLIQRSLGLRALHSGWTADSALHKLNVIYHKLAMDGCLKNCINCHSQQRQQQVIGAARGSSNNSNTSNRNSKKQHPPLCTASFFGLRSSRQSRLHTLRHS